jgi:exosortase/archaeosortase
MNYLNISRTSDGELSRYMSDVSWCIISIFVGLLIVDYSNNFFGYLTMNYLNISRTSDGELSRYMSDVSWCIISIFVGHLIVDYSNNLSDISQ